MLKRILWAAAALLTLASTANAACDAEIGGTPPYTFAQFEVQLEEELACLTIGSDIQAYDADLAVIAALADPNADRILFWDDSAGAYAYLEIGSGLAITGTTLATTGGGGGDSVRVEDGDNTAAFTAATDPDFDDSGDIDFTLDTAATPDTIIGNVRANSVALTTDTTGSYAAGDAEAGAALTGDSATAFFSAGTVDDARIDGSAEADEVNPTLGTQTQGNYVSALTAGAGLAVTHTPGEGSSGDYALSYTDQGASPALAADACQFTSNATTSGFIVCEGDTADAFETRIHVTDATADRLVTVPNADSATVQPLTCGAGDFISAVSALGALTCTTPAGGSGDSIRIEDGDNAGTFTAAADADFDDAGDINFVNGGGSPASVTAEIRSGAVGTTEAAALDAGDTTTGTFGDARVDGSAEADELVLAGDVDGTANANDLDEASVETELEGVLDLADMQGDLALGTKTSGNYVDDVIAGTGIAVTHAAGEGSDATVALSFSDAGADPALGADECRFTSNATTGGYIVCEGDTADTIETRIVITDPTASDKTFTIPNGASVGLTDADKGDITVASSGTDFQIDAGAVGTSEAAALDTGDITTGAFADARVDGSLEADEVNPTLGTQTVGNFVADVADGTGIDGTAAAEGATYTPTLDLTEINSTVFGSGTFTTLGFNAGAVDPLFTFGSGTVDLSAVTTFTLDDELELRFFEEDAGGSNYIGFKAPAALTANVTCVFENDGNPIPDSCVGDGTDAGAAGGIANVVEDLTPQLGGALDTNGFAIELGTAATDTSLVRSSAGNISIEGNVVYRAGGTDVALADGGTGASLVDPNADRLFFWDDSAGATDWLTVNAPIAITTTSIDINAATDTTDGSVELATTAEAETGTDTTRAVTAAGLLAAVSGKHTIYVPAGAMISETTTGCATGTVESATNLVMYKTMDCDGATQEGVQFTFKMPKSADESTVTMALDWTNASGTGDTIWLFSCLARSNDDPIDTAFGTEVSVTDTVLAALDVHVTAESGAITAGGTPAESDMWFCRVQRDADAAGDTLNAVDAKILGVRILYSINAMTDD